MPLSILEAMSAGLPIIGSDVIGNNSIIKNDYNGYLIPLQNLNNFKNKIIELNNDQKKIVTYSKNSIKLIQRKYSLDKMVNQYEKLYLSM